MLKRSAIGSLYKGIHICGYMYIEMYGLERVLIRLYKAVHMIERRLIQTVLGSLHSLHYLSK